MSQLVISTAMPLHAPHIRSSRFTLLALAALNVMACDDSEGGAQDTTISDASFNSPERGAQDAAASDASHVKTDARQTDASSNSRGIGTMCEDTPCPEGLSCQRPSVCPDFSCDKICVRPTESCVSNPCDKTSWCQKTLGSEAGTCQPRAAMGGDCSMPPGGDPNINTCAEGLFCSAESDTCVPVLAAGATCPSLWLGTDRQACVEGYACASTFGSDAKCVPVKQLRGGE